jgi:conjugative relaxase-like TrwC/TraI family protein
LLRGWSPDGFTPLVSNAGAIDRLPGCDLTFSALKSVSIVWALADVNSRRLLACAHVAAVREALAYAEETVLSARRDRGGVVREPARLAVALFPHATSRALDPQLHVHCLVVNVTVHADGTTGAIESRPLFRHKMAIGALYRAELSAGLENALGLRLRRTRAWFEVEGVPPELVHHFSKRRQAITRSLAGLGMDSPGAAAVAALATRPEKAARSLDELLESWRESGRAFGFTPARIAELLGKAPRRDVEAELRETMGAAIRRLMRQSGPAVPGQLVRFAAEEAQGRGLSIRHLNRAVDAHSREETERAVDRQGGRPVGRMTETDNAAELIVTAAREPPRRETLTEEPQPPWRDR